MKIIGLLLLIIVSKNLWGQDYNIEFDFEKELEELEKKEQVQEAESIKRVEVISPAVSETIEDEIKTNMSAPKRPDPIPSKNVPEIPRARRVRSR